MQSKNFNHAKNIAQQGFFITEAASNFPRMEYSTINDFHKPTEKRPETMISIDPYKQSEEGKLIFRKTSEAFKKKFL